MITTINTENWSEKYRTAAVDPAKRSLLVTNFSGTEQEKDLSEPPNCAGFGRVRHFRLGDNGRWPKNQLPIEPARKALGLPESTMLRAQVFQNAVCNWRCWYCFVPFSLLNANPRHSSWLTPEQLVDLYLADADPPPVIDLSGGQPDLTPEWIPWMMAELERRGLHERTYLWSDDNLSNDYFWRYVSAQEQESIRRYKNYGRVACFKGIDAESFAFNTAADPSLFAEQFHLFRRFVEMGIDLYAYVTFTTPAREGIDDAVRDFIERLQSIHPLLPLRTVPLEIMPFTPVQGRLHSVHMNALENQYLVADSWHQQLAQRYAPELISANICDISLRLN